MSRRQCAVKSVIKNNWRTRTVGYRYPFQVGWHPSTGDIVVDTNVVSELMRGGPHPAVLAWVAAQPRALIYTTFVN
jgi:hypothetical protein